MNELLAHDPGTDWKDIAPHLDAALGELPEPERDALMLRYFERKTAREMAQTLGISDEAAQKRVSRAVEHLRELFAKRGVTAGATGLAVLLTANAVQAAPVGLAVTISAAATLTAATLTATATATAVKTIAMTTLQKTLVTATVAVLAGAGIYEARQASQLRDQVQTLQQQQGPMAEEIQRLQSERDDATNQLVALREDNERLNRNTSELLKLRNELTQLKAATLQMHDGPAELAMKSWLSRVNQLKQRLAQMPDKGIPELKYLTETDWLEAVRNSKVDTEIEARQALHVLRNVAKEKVASVFSETLRKYIKANDGKFPEDIAQLGPYFESPMNDSILQRYSVLRAADVTNMGLSKSGADWLIAEKAPVDSDYDTRFVIGATSRGRSDFDADALIPVVRAFQTANSGQQVSEPSQLLPFVQTPDQQRALQKWMQRFPTLQK